MVEEGNENTNSQKYTEELLPKPTASLPATQNLPLVAAERDLRKIYKNVFENGSSAFYPPHLLDFFFSL